MLVYEYITRENIRKQISINLLDTNFVRVWKEYLQDLSMSCPKIKWYIAAINDTSIHRCYKLNQEDLTKIKQSFSYFVLHDLKNFKEEIKLLDFLISNPNLVSQEHLNLWHRIFTSLEKNFLQEYNKIVETLDRNELFKYIQDINTYTHKMEMYTYQFLPKRKEFYEKQYSIQFTNANNLNYLDEDNQVFSIKNIRFIKDFEFDFFNEEYHSNVWLHEDITGKDQMKAWLDEDDLSEFDITGNMLFTPSITLDPYNIYSRILDNDDFRKKSLNSRKKLNRFPLGNIKDCQSIDWEEFYKSKVSNIILNDNVLWGPY